VESVSFFSTELIYRDISEMIPVNSLGVLAPVRLLMKDCSNLTNPAIRYSPALFDEEA
jgi:hypothetical protein